MRRGWRGSMWCLAAAVAPLRHIPVRTAEPSTNRRGRGSRSLVISGATCVTGWEGLRSSAAFGITSTTRSSNYRTTDTSAIVC